MSHTYSLRLILQSDLQPALRELMLDQMKSPLLEHSFQFTNDEDGSLHNRSTPLLYQNRSSRKIKKLQQSAQDKEFAKLSRRLMKRSLSKNYKPIFPQNYCPPIPVFSPPIKMAGTPINRISHTFDQFQNLNSILSPFDHVENITLNAQNQVQNESEYEGVDKWCGQFLQQYGEAYQMQRPYARKPIFPKQSQQIKKKLNQKICIMSTQRRQIVEFVDFIKKCLTIFQKINQNLQYFIKIGAKSKNYVVDSNPELDGAVNSYVEVTNLNRIFNRLGVKSLTEAFLRLGIEQQSTKSELKTKKQNKIMADYSEIEQIIGSYLLDRDRIKDLCFIYSHVLTPNFPKLKLSQKIKQLLNQYDNPYLKYLQYIWPNLQILGAYSTTIPNQIPLKRHQFINELCRNHILIHEQLREYTLKQHRIQ